MKRQDKSINDIIHDSLIGQASEEDTQQLQEWIETSSKNKSKYNELINESTLSDRYRQYDAIDTERAWKSFRKRYLPTRHLLLRRTLRYASIFVLVSAIAYFWFIKESNVSRLPDISHEVMVAMLRSQNAGKQKATLVLSNGKQIVLQSLPKSEKAISSIEETAEDTESQSSAENKLMTHNDSEYWITLDDGTRIHLNYSTTLKYPSRFDGDSRRVYLDGEAYFYVAKDSKRPFYVETPNGTIREYGTSFNVNTKDEAGTTKVVLVEGSISILANDGHEYMMKPGELAIAQSESNKVHINKVDIEPYIAWNSGCFVFDNCPLETLMKRISLWYGQKVVFANDDIRQLRYSGSIDRYSSINLVLKAIENVTGLRIENTQNKIVIK